MMKIDAHQHFWQFDPIRDAWIDDTMSVIQRDFLPEDLGPILFENRMDGCVAVQADQSETETKFLLDLAAKNNFIHGVVGWVDLRSEDVEERLAHYAQNDLFKGVRHIAQGEADDFLLREDVQRGIGFLSKYDLTYDILVFARQLPAAIELVKAFPDQKFVLDHLAKPQFSKGLDKEWQSNIAALGKYPNVFCKLSGMVTETDDFKWKKSDFIPFLEVIFSSFGKERVMYGSDWPVCLLAADYGAQLNILQAYISDFSRVEQSKIMGGNAVSFYDLKINL